MGRIRVQLTDDEVASVRQWAAARGNPKESWSTTMRWAKGGDYHFLGLLGEMAYAKHYSVPLDTEVLDLGDGGIDLCILGQTVDVKTSTNPDPILKLNSIKDFKAEMMALALKVSDNTVDLCGFCDLRSMIRHGYKRDFGHGPRVCLDEQFLYF